MIFYSSRSIRPLCLPSGDLNTDSDPSGKPISATVAGWGKMGFNGKQSTVLRLLSFFFLSPTAGTAKITKTSNLNSDRSLGPS